MGDFDAIHCAVPCETWSIARDEELVCRTRTHPLRMDGLPRNLAEKSDHAQCASGPLFGYVSFGRVQGRRSNN